MKKTDQNLVGEGKDEDDDSFRKSKKNIEVKETSQDKNMISDQLYNIPKKTRSEKKTSKIVIYSSLKNSSRLENLPFLQVSSSEGLENT